MIKFYSRKKASGFSLIELLIVIAIIGIIVAIGIPSYSSYITKTQRLDATGFLTEVAGEQIRFFSENNRFGTTMGELGYGDAATAPSKEGLYTISVDSNTATSYVLTATPVTGGPQANDAECGTYTLNSSDQKTVSGTSSVENCW